jgi:acyl transferase domain-containing protein
VVLSGAVDVLESVAGELSAAGVRCRRVDVDYASHSPAVDAVRAVFEASCAGVSPRRSDTAFFSGVSGGVLDPAELGGGYWFRNLRERVSFGQAVREMLGGGYRFLVEVSPHPVQAAGIQDCIDAAGVEAVVVPTLRRGAGEWASAVAAASAVHAAGAQVDWEQVTGRGSWAEGLPTYAFQRERYWFDGVNGGQSALSPGGDRAREAAFWRAVDEGDPELLAGLGLAHSGWAELLPALAAWRRQPSAPPADEPAATPLTGLERLSPSERSRVVQDLVRSEVAAVLGHRGPTDVDPARNFLELGIDSVMALQLRNRLRLATGLPLPMTLLFDHPSCAELTAAVLAARDDAVDDSGMVA